MRKLIVCAVLASAALGLGVAQSSAASHGYGGGYHQTQYGGGYGHQQRCYWERRHVRIWDESHHRWSWVWRRVQVCN